MAKQDTAPTAEDLGLVKSELENDASSSQENSSEPKKRGRGRPKGSHNGEAKPKKSTARKTEDVAALAKQIQGIHVMIAMMTGFPEMQINDFEAQMLASSVSGISEQYGLSLDGKTGAAIQLFGACAIIYVPRAMSIQAKKKQAQEENITDVPFVDPGRSENASTNH